MELEFRKARLLGYVEALFDLSGMGVAEVATNLLEAAGARPNSNRLDEAELILERLLNEALQHPIGLTAYKHACALLISKLIGEARNILPHVHGFSRKVVVGRSIETFRKALSETMRAADVWQFTRALKGHCARMYYAVKKLVRLLRECFTGRKVELKYCALGRKACGFWDLCSACCGRTVDTIPWPVAKVERKYEITGSRCSFCGNEGVSVIAVTFKLPGGLRHYSEFVECRKCKRLEEI